MDISNNIRFAAGLNLKISIEKVSLGPLIYLKGFTFTMRLNLNHNAGIE